MAAAEAVNIYCPFAQCQADLIQIALFLYLLSCNYTKMNLHRQMVQFQLQDMQFNNADRVIPHESPSKNFLYARDLTLFLDTQKNIIRCKSTTMEATDLAHSDPISAAAWHFLRLSSPHAEPDTTICSCFTTKGALPKIATRTHIVSLLRLHATKIGFQYLGFYPQKIGSHSLRSGGNMTPH